MQFTIITLIGIPASGKSTLASIILKLSKEKSLNYNTIIISFDELLKIDFNTLSNGDYKQSREDLLSRVEDLIENLKTSSDWANILDIDQKYFHINDENSLTLVVLDDNMYYRSMRQRIRQMCKKLDCHHFQIFLKCNIDDAISRNSKRVQVVSNQVITKMNNNLEEPVNDRTIVIEIENLNLNDFHLILRDRISQPEEMLKDELKQPQEQSIIHEFDLISRKEVGTKIQQIKMLISGDNLGLISANLNEIRKIFMENIRNGKIKIKNIDELIQSFRQYMNE
jgi:O-phosphoseryl-tRNA(Sec) kinase